MTFDPDWMVNPEENAEYTLYSVISHHGESADGGHYNAIVRYNVHDPAKQAGPCQWYMYDDMTNRLVGEHEIMKHAQNAYLLIFMLDKDRVDLLPPKMHDILEEHSVG